MNQSEQFDCVLDEALACYGEAEPLAGIEERVLRRLSQRSRKRTSSLGWRFATGLLTATLLVAVLLVLRDPSYRPPVEKTRLAEPPVQKVPPLSPATNFSEILNSTNADKFYPATPPSGTFARPRRYAAEASQEARPLTAVREPFPAPTPLTPSERALMTLAEADPQALRTLSRAETEIAIAPIEIKPLAGDYAGDEGDN